VLDNNWELVAQGAAGKLPVRVDLWGQGTIPFGRPSYDRVPIMNQVLQRTRQKLHDFWQEVISTEPGI
jgi:hypothetical protein